MKIIHNETEYFLQGNIADVSPCEYISTNSDSQLQVAGTTPPAEEGQFILIQNPNGTDAWAIRDLATQLFMVRTEDNEALCISEDPVFFDLAIIGEDEVYTISYFDEEGLQLCLSMPNTEVGSQVVFSEYNQQGSASQDWKFIRARDSHDDDD
jgi:hypothetical protein